MIEKLLYITGALAFYARALPTAYALRASGDGRSMRRILRGLRRTVALKSGLHYAQ
jgi:hypothetical protein